jgi:hypothetical protein
MDMVARREVEQDKPDLLRSCTCTSIVTRMEACASGKVWAHGYT